jgi:hypothetical protein
MEHKTNENSFIITCPDFRQVDTTLPVLLPRAILIQAIYNLDTAIITKVANRLGLPFINQTEASGEVCFANDPALRPEFRQSFTPADLLAYIYAVLLHRPGNAEMYHYLLNTGSAHVPYPVDAADFWYLVKLGNALSEGW